MSKKVIKTCFEFQFDSMIMAIIPEQYGSKLYSRVLKTDGEVLIPYSPLEVIKKSCHLYASSFEGRKEGTKELIGVTHKPPIVIDPIQSIYFFPTASPKQRHCMWISHSHVLTYNNAGSLNTEVIFTNKMKLQIPMSCGSFDKQMLRTALLKTKIDPRFIQTERNRQILYQRFEQGLEAMERRSHYDVSLDEPFEGLYWSSKRLNK